jgi:hypothetical protein
MVELGQPEAESLRASNEMPGVPEAAKIKSPKDAGRPHTEGYVADLGRRAAPICRRRQAWRVFC